MHHQIVRPEFSESRLQDTAAGHNSAYEFPHSCKEVACHKEDGWLPSYYWGDISRKDGQNWSIKIFCDDGMYGLKLSVCRFKSLRALVQYYNRHTLAEFNSRLTTFLLYPVRKPRVRKVDINEALCILAEKGRKQNEARRNYIFLLDQEKEVNNALHLSTMKELAYQNALDMIDSLIMTPNFAEDDLEINKRLNSKNKSMLDANRTEALKLHRVIKEQTERAADSTRLCTEELNRIVGAINARVTKLMDIEDECALIKEKLLNGGAKPEMVDCLLDDDVLENPWDRSLWLVNCNRSEAVARLADMEIGTFLIRPKDQYEMPYVLSIVCNNEDGTPVVKHCVIHHPEGRGYGFLQEGSVFTSVDELVYKHAHASIKIYFAHMDTCLAYPVFLGRSRGNSCEENVPKDDCG